MDTSYVIAPIEKSLIKQELNKDIFFRKTNNGSREIYITTAHKSPNIMREIGRLRELSFGAEGGGSGRIATLMSSTLHQSHIVISNFSFGTQWMKKLLEDIDTYWVRIFS